jgi:hypothetical protein
MSRWANNRVKFAKNLDMYFDNMSRYESNHLKIKVIPKHP